MASQELPPALRPEEITTLLAELSPLALGARVEKVYDRPPFAFLFRLRTPTKRSLIFSTRPKLSRLHLVEEVGASPKRPSSAATDLRALLGGMRIIEIDQPGADRVARIRFRRGKDDAPREELDLVFEFFGSAGRLIVLEPETKKIRFVAGRGGWKVKERYRYPDPPRKASGETWTIPFDPLKHIPEELRESPAPFHRFLELRFRDQEARADRQEKLRGWGTRLRRERKRRRQLLPKLERDFASAQDWEEWQRRGELLKGAQGTMRRGQSSIEVTDWYEEGTPQIEIALDPEATPAENVERCFRRARKGKRALPELTERIERQREAMAAIEEWLTALEAANDDAAEQRLMKAVGPEIDAWLGENERRSLASSPKKGSRKPAAGRASKFRQYRTREGLEVLAGRSARDNDELSIRVARGNDLFFHRAGRPGPHVIVRVPKGRQASPESIDDAAFLAAYLAGWRGPGDERVVWTEAKHVRKPKGLAPGQVLTHRTREHRVRYDAKRIAGLSLPKEGSEER